MLIRPIILSALSKNYKPEVYKKDPRIKAAAIRAIYELISYSLLKADEKGKVLGKELAKLDSLPNYELLDLIECAIVHQDSNVLDHKLMHVIVDIDYLGKCWYSAKEMTFILEAITQQKHSVSKVRKMLDNIFRESKCIRMMDKYFIRQYRVNYTTKISPS